MSIVIGSTFGAHAQEVEYLWPKGAPGFEHLSMQKEQAKDWWVKNVHNPSITVFLAEKEKRNGTSVLIFPGGGHRELVFDEEGTKTAMFLNTLGINAFVLKYRLAREENSPYKLDKHPKEDAERAIRLLRKRSKDWGIQIERLGVMGFSAGGEVAAMVAYSNIPHPNPVDAVDKISAKVDFQILIYPGPLGIPDTVNRKAPPTFLLVAINDDCCTKPSLKLLNAYKQSEASIEAHFYAQGGHGFNMGDRSKLKSLAKWPNRLADWLHDGAYLE